MFLVKWFKNKAVDIAINYLVKEIEKCENKDRNIYLFRDAFYNKPIEQFLKWGLEELEGGVTTITTVQLIKKRLETLRDDIEGIIIKVIDGLNPKK